MRQAFSWLPYRVRDRWDQWRISLALRRLSRTAPLPVAPCEQADAEIHMLICRRDLLIGVLTLKSLLRFGGPRWAVTFTDDGSLTAGDRAWLTQHLPGCRFHPRFSPEPELQAAFRQRPHLEALYRSSYFMIAKLLHPIVLGRCSRMLQLDTDTAFFRRPQMLLEWAQGPACHAWYLRDHQDEAQAVPAETRQAFAELASLISPAGRPWTMPYYFFNAGMLAYRRELCRLDVVETYLAWRQQAPQAWKTGRPGMWFGDWTPEQTAYQLMFAAMDPPPQPFDDDYHLGGQAGHVFNHFLREYLVKESTLARLQALVDELPRARS